MRALALNKSVSFSEECRLSISAKAARRRASSHRGESCACGKGVAAANDTRSASSDDVSSSDACRGDGSGGGASSRGNIASFRARFPMAAKRKAVQTTHTDTHQLNNA